ncbi:MAG: hypothetical protein LUE12_01920 [Ruminococcus sp.]|nr:hypothetical protein [Ruminococcus sp.]
MGKADKARIVIFMTRLIAFCSRTDENYFGGKYQYITVGNTEKGGKDDCRSDRRKAV